MDPISDMFIRIKNAQKAGHSALQLPYSKFKHEIAKVLENSGFVGKIERKGKKVRKTLEIELNDEEKKLIVHDVRLLSKPSRRLYASHDKLPLSRHGGIVIVSTSKGVMSALEAKKAKIGGQLIAEVW